MRRLALLCAGIGGIGSCQSGDVTTPPNNQAPSVNVDAPLTGATITHGAAVSVTATASDPDGSVVSVEFLDGATSLGTDASTPYAVDWSPNSIGAHILTARATDDGGATTTSPQVAVTVASPPNQPPTVSLTAPSEGATLDQGAPATVSATAGDPDGRVVAVEFFDGTNSLGINTSSPYAVTWTPASTGGHALTARATDDSGATTTSPPVGVIVTPAGNQPPSGTITAPAGGSFFSGGETISYAGTGTDPEDGNLPGSRFTWWVVLHHAAHTHPFVPPTTGANSGSFLVPPRGHTEDDIYLRVYLSVSDAGGLADTSYVDVQPRKVTLSFAGVPDGVVVTVDGQPRGTPFGVISVVGMERDIGAPSPQVIDTDSLEWLSWSDGGPALHTVVTPTANSGYTATFQVVAIVNQDPVVSLTTPIAGATITQGTATPVTATATDPDGSVLGVEFFDGATSLGTDNAAPFAVTWTPAATGPHTLTARATDNDGGVTISAPVGVNVVPAGSDGTPPSVQLTSPTDGTTGLTGSPTFTATATDNIGVVGVTFQVDGVTLREDLTAPYQATLPATSDYTSGVHVVRARARDAAGNLSPWSMARVTFSGSSLPAGFNRTTLVSGFQVQPTAMAWSPDGRLFVAEQGGAVRVIKNGVLLSTPFTTVTTTEIGERGLLGLAFHPQFTANHWVYLYYTSELGGAHNRIVRVIANGDTSSSTETVLVDLPNLSSATNHNGGALHFGPDGKLYVAVGDNADGNKSQSMSSPFGKILRFNDDGTIPASNPFYGSTTGTNRAIWALGLRNPFTFGFQPVTGRMFINDVGESTWEEVNEGLPGANFGWPVQEGSGGAPTYSDPLYAYRHSGTNNPSLVVGFAIAGAAFYSPTSSLFPAEYQGSFFFADYVSGWVNRLDTVNENSVNSFWNYGSPITDLSSGPDGALYVLADMGNSWGVYRIGHP